MKQIIFLVLLTFLSFTSCNIGDKKADAKPKESIALKTEDDKSKNYKTPVLVELFTSEGCSSCPPADLALAKLQNEQPVENVEIITLAFHVDYWNYLGWKDEFSSAEYSRRQGDYSNALNLRGRYTPQMVIDGKSEFVGSRYNTALVEIKKSAETKKGKIVLKSDIRKDEVTLNIKLEELALKENADVWLAIAEDNLETDVKRGENEGRKLLHTSVVRSLKKIDQVLKNKTEYKTDKIIQMNPTWKKNNLNFVVFIQSQKTKEIYAVGREKVS